MTYVDWQFYLDDYAGRVIRDEATFNGLSRRASLYLDSVTFGRLRHGWPITTDVKAACCLLSEKIQEQDELVAQDTSGGYIKSESLDGYSVTYGDSEDRRQAFNKELYAIAYSYLIYTGIMDRSLMGGQYCKD